MSFKKELEELSKKYVKKPRPTTLKQACLISIQKWEETINLVIKNKKDYNMYSFSLINLGYNSCGLCKFYGVDMGNNLLCNYCPLKRCGSPFSIYTRVRHARNVNDFVHNAYKLIKKIRKRYKKITGDTIR